MEDKLQFEAWLEKEPISTVAFDTLKEARIPATIENLKALWLNFLDTELSDGLHRCVRYMRSDAWKF
jgi:hypothetical protein